MSYFALGLEPGSLEVFKKELGETAKKYTRPPRKTDSLTDEKRGDFYDYDTWKKIKEPGDDTEIKRSHYVTYINGKLTGTVLMQASDLTDTETLSILKAFFDLIDKRFRENGITLKKVEVKD